MKWIWVCAVVCAASVAAPAGAFDEAHSAIPREDSLDFGILAHQAEALIQVVLANHVDPPTRQEMWLAGTRAVFENVPGTSPSGLSTRISQITRPEEYRDFLRQAWFHEISSEQRRTALPPARLTAEFLKGLLRPVPEAQILSTSEGVAREQLAGNRYVGTGISLQSNRSTGYPAIGVLIRGGPMERAGGREGDLITKIDEHDTHNLPVERIVELLRGDAGTTVPLQLRGTETGDPRTVIVTRGPVVLDAVEGLTRDHEGKWDFRIEPFLPISYIKFRQINGSTVHELRRIERRFRANGVAAVILDFRSTSTSDVHQAVLLADALMDGGVIGRLRSPGGRVREFQSDGDCLFRGLPLAVLVDGTTSGGGEWIAAALQDNGACIVVGEPSAGSSRSNSIVRMPGNDLSVQLPTGTFERPTPKPMEQLASPVPLDRVANPTIPSPTKPSSIGVTPDRIVPTQNSPIVSVTSANEVRRLLRRERDPTGGKDIVIATAVQELRKRIK